MDKDRENSESKKTECRQNDDPQAIRVTCSKKTKKKMIKDLQKLLKKSGSEISEIKMDDKTGKKKTVEAVLDVQKLTIADLNRIMDKLTDRHLPAMFNRESGRLTVHLCSESDCRWLAKYLEDFGAQGVLSVDN